MKINNAVGPQVRAAKPKKNPLLPILGVFSLGAGLQSATQFFAYTLKYHSALGESVNLGENIRHVYAPWKILQWSANWHGLYSDEFIRAGSIGVLVSGVGLLTLAVVKVVSSNTSKANQYLHGSARWADKQDIESAGLMPRRRSGFEFISGKAVPPSVGVYVGGWEDKSGNFYYLRHNGPEHVLCYAPTRSGKGVGLVIPTLLSWGQSTVITDLKGELWALTAGWRKKCANNTVLRFEPAAANGSVCWNPLDEIRLGDYEVGDVQNLATLIVDPDGKGLETHWQKTAFALLVGVILHALYKAKIEGTAAT
ncbi:partial Conjugal transfer protein TraG, partial [Anaerolineae bacterium]